jgi:hypothetical protein
MSLYEWRGRASEETRPVAGGETGKAITAKQSVPLKAGPVKQRTLRESARARRAIQTDQGLISPREIFLEYRHALTKGFKVAVQAEKKENIWGPHWDEYVEDEKERWAALFTLCRMFKWDPRDLGISFFGNKILGPTVRTEKILIRLVLWLIQNQLDELMKAA